MGVTVNYKNSTIGTFNSSITLNTSGKWMEDDIDLAIESFGGYIYQDENGYVVLDNGVTDFTNIIPLSVSSNGIYSASSGYAYNPITVNVSGEEDVWAKRISGTISEAIDYGGSFTRIGAYAFAYCYNLTTASFPNVSYIEHYAFYSCRSLTTISFPKASYIGDSAFYSCWQLISINFPSASYIGSSAFYYCQSLANISFPSASYIGSSAFAYCSKLSKVDFPNVSNVGNYAFVYCYSLTSISFPKASVIGSSAFYSCRSLTTISFPSVSNIGGSAFYSCSRLSKVDFPNVSYIGSYAFAYCYSLTTAILNYSGTTQGTIYTYAFRNCYLLLSLYLLASTLYRLSVSSTTFISTPISTYTTSTGGVYGSIFVPSSLYNAYISSTNWSYYSSRFASLTDAQISKVLASGTHL